VEIYKFCGKESETVHLLGKESEKTLHAFCKDSENMCLVCQGKWEGKKCDGLAVSRRKVGKVFVLSR
jgi:hypothetical protein